MYSCLGPSGDPLLSYDGSKGRHEEAAYIKEDVLRNNWTCVIELAIARIKKKPGDYFMFWKRD